MKTENGNLSFMTRYIPESRSFIKIQTLESARHPLKVKFQRLHGSKEMVLYVVRDDVTDNIQVYVYQVGSYTIYYTYSLRGNGFFNEMNNFTQSCTQHAGLEWMEFGA